ncbi:MAG: uroporphyrinogen-III C-methyltransferase [Nitrospinae bacterium]|nr:uroporphyrinogen-III C-methyltransferase [Nitrospinota bacterium]
MIQIQTSLGQPVLDIQLLENTDQCLGKCYAILLLHPYQSLTLQQDSDKLEFQLLQEEEYIVTTPIYETITTTCTDNQSQQYQCQKTRKTGEQTEVRKKQSWIPFPFWEETLEAGKDYTIKIKGEKIPSLGENNIDWLLTLKGRDVLRRAGAVVYDRLIDATLLELPPPWACLLPVGKVPGRHAVSQDAINELLKEQAGKHEVVVRLKGGDPFIFGRGGEEADFLQAEGIAFEVVPGVSAAAAAPAYAGIPLTHRDCASSFAVATAHPACAEETIPIAVPEADTLVYLMGLANLPAIVKALLSKGRSPDTPVAVISMATTARQQVVSAPLEAIAEEARRADLLPPAVIVVGEVVRFSDRLQWFREGGARAFPVDASPQAASRSTLKQAKSALAG